MWFFGIRKKLYFIATMSLTRRAEFSREIYFKSLLLKNLNLLNRKFNIAREMFEMVIIFISERQYCDSTRGGKSILSEIGWGSSKKWRALILLLLGVSESLVGLAARVALSKMFGHRFG